MQWSYQSKEGIQGGVLPWLPGAFSSRLQVFLTYFRSVAFHSVAFHSLLLGCHHIANLFHQLLLLDNRTGVRDSWCGQQSVWTAHCHHRDSNPRPTREALTGQYHSAIGPYCLTGELSHSPTVRPGYCEYDSILNLHGADVGPLPRQGCAAGKPHKSQLPQRISS